MTHPFQTASDVRKEREAREAVAADTASKLPPGMDLYADGCAVVNRTHGYPVVATCNSHWDACLVMLAYGNRMSGWQCQRRCEARQYADDKEAKNFNAGYSDGFLGYEMWSGSERNWYPNAYSAGYWEGRSDKEAAK